MKKNLQWIAIFLFLCMVPITVVNALGSESSIAGGGGGGGDNCINGCRTYGVVGIRVSIEGGDTRDYYGTNLNGQYPNSGYFYTARGKITWNSIGNQEGSISDSKSGLPGFTGTLSAASLSSINFGPVATYFNNLSKNFNSAISKNGASQDVIEKTDLYKLLKRHNVSDIIAKDCDQLKNVYIKVEPITMIAIGDHQNKDSQTFFIGTAAEIAAKISNPSSMKIVKNGVEVRNATTMDVKGIAQGTIDNYITLPKTVGKYTGPQKRFGIIKVMDNSTICEEPKVYCKLNTKRNKLISVKDDKKDYTLCCDPANYEPGTETTASIESSKWFQESDQAASCRPKKVYCKLNTKGTKLETIKDNSTDSTLCCDASNYESMTITSLKKTTWYDENCAPKCDINNPSGKTCCNLKSVDGTYNYKQSDLKTALQTSSLTKITQAKFEDYLKKNHTSFFNSTCTSTVVLSPCKVSLLGTYQKNGNLKCCTIVSKTGEDNYTESDLKTILSVVSDANFKKYLQANFKEYYDQCYGIPKPEPNCEIAQISQYLSKKDTSCCDYSEYDEKALKSAFVSQGISGIVNQTNFNKFLSESTNETYRKFYSEVCNKGTNPDPENPIPDPDTRTCTFEQSTDCPNCDLSSSKGMIGENISGGHDPKYCILKNSPYKAGIQYYGPKEGGGQTKYCEVYCKTTAEYFFPNKGFTIAGGQHFTVGGSTGFTPISLTVKKECYAEIATGAVRGAIREANENYEDGYNAYLKKIAQLEIYVGGEVGHDTGSAIKAPECGCKYTTDDIACCKETGRDVTETKSYETEEEMQELLREGFSNCADGTCKKYGELKCTNRDYTGHDYLKGGTLEYTVLANTQKSIKKYTKDGVLNLNVKEEGTNVCLTPTVDKTSDQIKEEKVKQYKEDLKKAEEDFLKYKQTDPTKEIADAVRSCESWATNLSKSDLGLKDVEPVISFKVDDNLRYSYTGNLARTESQPYSYGTKYYEKNLRYMLDTTPGGTYLYDSSRQVNNTSAYTIRPKKDIDDENLPEVEYSSIYDLMGNSAIGAMFEKNYTFCLPNDIYNYIDKTTSGSFMVKPNESNYIYIPYGNIPIALDQAIGDYDISITLETFGRNIALGKYLETGKKSGCEYTDTCPITITKKIQPNVPNTDRSYLDVVYRPISLTNPFVIQNLNRNNSGTTGANWCSDVDCRPNNATVEQYITNNRGAETDKVYEKEPMYKITLNAARILEIRKYNNEHKYDDFNLTCTGGTGRECTSSFIRETYRNYFDNTCGTGIWRECDNRDGITR